MYTIVRSIWVCDVIWSKDRYFGYIFKVTTEERFFVINSSLAIIEIKFKGATREKFR